MISEIRNYIWLAIPLLLSSCSTTVLSQQVINVETMVTGQLSLAPGISIPKINPGYTLWLPDTKKPRGMIVFTHARRDTVQTDSIIDYALDQQLAVLYASTDNRLEFLFEDEKIQEIEGYIYSVISKYQIPKENLLFCGMSLEGTRALKLALYARSPQSKHKLLPKAIAICDAPIDMIRFHREMVKAKGLNFNPTAANEGTWVSAYLEKNLGGTPQSVRQAFVDYSPFTYFADNGNQKLPLLREVAIRAYTEPDVNWWIDTRRKDYYGMNAIDLAALVNELKIIGHENAELIITSNKGYRPDGSRHPHSWSIVEEKELVEWFVSLLK